ncbi:MAG: RNA 2',3'-cyclic phosphodiesterase [Proteobacteria bacterium]|nr:RNA 2',3'-cyclic phosphodiesterase [Pseudomonadota bacterium]
MPRLFIAVDLPAGIKNNLEIMSYGIPGAKWIDPQQIHLTVRFIGEVDGTTFLDIKTALEQVSLEPFSMALKGVGHFPPRGKPRVLWVGIEQSEPLQSLKSRIDRILATVGLQPEGRKFSPHITLARLKNSPIHKVADFLAGNGLFSQEPFEIKDFKLYSSTLTPKGAIHKVEKVYPLTD